MAEQLGVYLAGTQVVINPGNAGQIVDANSDTLVVTEENSSETVVAEADPSAPQVLKVHTGYEGSEWYSDTRAITTSSALTISIASFDVEVDKSISVRAFVTGRRATNDASCMFVIYGNAYNDGGTSLEILAYPVVQLTSANASDVTVTIVSEDSSDTLDVRVSGQNAQTWYWVGKFETLAIATDV